MLTWIRDNPQFAALIFVVAVLAIVMGTLALIMTRAGVSLRPLVWFLGFFAIVAGPQAVVHFLDGMVIRQAAQQPENQTSPPRASSHATSERAPVSWDVVFGPDADPALITDAKHGLAQVLGDAKEAKMSFHREGSSALAARFDSPASAARALDAYGTFFAFADARGSDGNGWTARRHGGQGEWVHIVTAGPELYAWTSAQREKVLANRERALGPIPAAEAASPKVASLPQPALVSQRLNARPGLMIGIVALNLVAAGLWFFKGSAWAARVTGSQIAKPISAAMLGDELMAINQRDVPTDVVRRPDGTIEINWRYADARWFDLMRLHRLKRTQRLVIMLDEASHTARVREYWSGFDASADARSVHFDWKAASGIQFFAFEHQRVFGAQFGADGKPTGELSKAYTFNLQELKRPIIEVVTRAGWTWQPLAWNAPESLRWLTE